MPSVQTFLSILMVTHSVTYVGGLSHNMNNKQSICNNNSRRAFLSTTAATAFFTAVTTTTIPQIANARYVLNEVTGEYDEVQDDEDWQSAWGKRLDKAKTMSKEDIFLAAQGAGNTDLKNGEESEASKKRRAFAGCRNDNFREKSEEKDVKECTKRVLSGDYQFMVDAMQ